MALISIPAKLSFTSVGGLTLSRNTSILRSKFTGQRQAVLYPMALWQIKAKLKDYAPEDAGAIRGFLAALRGQTNTFKLPVPGYVRPSSNALVENAGNGGTIAAAAVRATQVITANFTPTSGANDGLKIGEYFNIGDELKIATANATPSGNQMVVQFEPPLRKAYPAGTPLIILNPYCLMYAADDDVASWGIRAPVIHSFDLDAIEAIDL
jgi:hypothetical protein